MYFHIRKYSTKHGKVFDFMRRKIVIAFIILFAFLLQTTLCRAVALASVSPNLLLIVAAAFGFMRGKKEGLLVGFFCGLIYDLFYGSYIGFYALLYMYVGYFNGLFHKSFADEDVKFPTLLIALSDFLFCAAIYGFRFLLRGRLNILYYILHVALPEIVYTVIITIFLYRLLLFINRRLEGYEKGRSGKFV